MEDNRGIVIGDECEVSLQNVDERLVLVLMSASILVGEVVVAGGGSDGNGGCRSDIF